MVQKFSGADEGQIRGILVRVEACNSILTKELTVAYRMQSMHVIYQRVAYSILRFDLVVHWCCARSLVRNPRTRRLLDGCIRLHCFTRHE